MARQFGAELAADLDYPWYRIYRSSRNLDAASVTSSPGYPSNTPNTITSTAISARTAAWIIRCFIIYHLRTLALACSSLFGILATCKQVPTEPR